MTPPLRAGLFGLGSMGRHHARILREIDDVELVALVDGNGDRHGVAGELEVFSEIEPALDLGLDLAVVAVPTLFHESVGCRLAEAGVNVLVEKPMAPSAEACRRMLSVFRSAGVFGAIGHVERFNPAIQEMKKLVSDGAVGAVRQISTRRQGPFPVRISDVGVGLDLATHDIDLTSWLSESEYQRLYGETWTAPGHEHEGVLNVLGILANGIMVNNTVNWHSSLRERVTIVQGDAGVLVADTASSTLRFYQGDSGDGEEMPVDAYEPLRAELEAFRDEVRGRESGICTFDAGAACVTVVAAALDSAAKGAPIETDHFLEHVLEAS
jgi:UDP-N-acetylglucosamine 3-dehydrogenase